MKGLSNNVVVERGRIPVGGRMQHVAANLYLHLAVRDTTYRFNLV